MLPFLIGNLSRGFVFPRAGLTLITESELFGEKQLRKHPAVSVKDHALAAFSELQVDDYVVHADHGIGIYRGLWKLKLGNEEHDFLLLEYQGGDKLYLPVYRLNLLQKYVGGGDGGPRIDKLGGTSWEKAKKTGEEVPARAGRGARSAIRHPLGGARDMPFLRRMNS